MKKTVFFGHIYDADLDAPYKVPRVSHPEIEPVECLARVRVVADEHVILSLLPPAHTLKVSTFEVCIEHHLLPFCLELQPLLLSKIELLFCFLAVELA